ncbi:MAG: type I-E CRISPR-associated protein Cas6/Cse3/CasE [Jatrophihabitantaceae bacterium]
MFLTRFEINPQRRDARKLLGSPQAMHAAVLAGFPPSQASEAGRVLWRVDPGAHSSVLYLVSPTQPDLSHLVEQAGWPSTTGWLSRDYRPRLDGLAADQDWAFRLTANTTRSTKLSPDAARSQRYGHVTVAQQREWLIERMPKLGCRLGKTSQDEPDLIVSQRSTKKFLRQGGTVTLSTATFDGSLIVDDPGALRAALTGGIGPAKAYGCGLLTLMPARPA